MENWKRCVKILTSKPINKSIEIEDVLFIAKTVTKYKEEVLSHDSKYECFYSALIALCAHYVHDAAKQLSKNTFETILSACKVILEFSHARLNEYDVQCVIHQNNLVQIIYVLCQDSTEMFPKSDIITFIAMIKTAKIPETETKSEDTLASGFDLNKMQSTLKLATHGETTTSETVGINLLIKENLAFLKHLSSRFKLLNIFKSLPYLKRYINRVTDMQKGKAIVLPNSDSNAVIVKNGLGPLSSNISAVHKIVQLPVVSYNLEASDRELLHTLDLSCMLAGVSVLTALGFCSNAPANSITSQETTESEIIEDQTASNTNSRAVAAQIINSILSIHKLIEPVLSYDGTRFKFSIDALQILSNGLKTAFSCNQLQENQLNPDYPGFRNLDLLSIKFNQELCYNINHILEDTSVSNSEKVKNLQEIFSTKLNSAEGTLNYLIDSAYGLFMWILNDVSDVKIFQEILTEHNDENEQDIRDNFEDAFLDTASNGSGENMFGELFKQSSASSEDSGITEKKDQDDDEPMELDENEYLKLLEIHRNDLTGHFESLINCITSLVQDKNDVLMNYTQEKITKTSLKQLITMVEILDEKDFMPVKATSSLIVLLHGVIADEDLRIQLEEVFKINPKSFLFLKPKMLSVAFQILFQKQSSVQKQGEEEIIKICNALVETIADLQCTQQTPYSRKNDIAVEIIQVCLFFFHTLSDQNKTNFMLSVINLLSDLAQSDKSPMAVTRLLTVFDYLLLHYVQPNDKLVDHVLSNMVTFHFNPPNNEISKTYNQIHTLHKKFTPASDKTQDEDVSNNFDIIDDTRDLFYMFSEKKDVVVCDKLLDDVKPTGIDLIQVLRRCLEAGSQISAIVEVNKADSNSLLIQRFIKYCFTMAKNALGYFDLDHTSTIDDNQNVPIHIINANLSNKLDVSKRFEIVEKLFKSYADEFMSTINADQADWIQSFSPLKLMVLDCLMSDMEFSVWNPRVTVSKECIKNYICLGLKLLNYFGKLCRDLALQLSNWKQDAAIFNKALKLGSKKFIAFMADLGNPGTPFPELPVALQKVLTDWDTKRRTHFTITKDKQVNLIPDIVNMYMKLLECETYAILPYIEVFLPTLFEFTSAMLFKYSGEVTKNELLASFDCEILPLQLDSIMGQYFDECSHSGFELFEIGAEKEMTDGQSRENIQHTIMLLIVSYILDIWKEFNIHTITEDNKNLVLMLQREYVDLFRSFLDNSDFCIALEHYVRTGDNEESDFYKGINFPINGSFVEIFETTDISRDSLITHTVIELLCEMFTKTVGTNANKQIMQVMEGFNKLSGESLEQTALVKLFTVPLNQELYSSKLETLLYKIARCLSHADSPICVQLVKAMKEAVSDKLSEKSVITMMNILIILARANGGAGHFDLFISVLQWIKTCRNEMTMSINQNEKVTILKSVYEFLLSYIMNVLSSVLGNKSDVEFSDMEDETMLVEDILINDSSAAMAEEDAIEVDPLWFSVCTYTRTQKEFMNQHWYHCHTCGMIDGVGVCSICAKVCHKNHDLSYAKFGSFFCDCGAKEDKSCKAMQPREPGKATREDSLTPNQTSKSLSSLNPAQSSQLLNAFQQEIKLKDQRKMALKVTNSSESLLQFLSSESGKVEVGELLLGIAKETQAMFYSPEKNILDESGSALAQKVIKQLHTNEKILKVVDDLMIPTLGSQEGAFENVKANYTGDQGQTIRQLIHARVIRRVGMCCLTNPSGRKHHLAVTHEKNKITMLQLSSLLKEADAKKRKLTLTRLSTSTVPFNIVTMSSNPCNEEVLAVCGLKDCHVIRYSSIGTTQEQLALHPQLSTGNCISKSLWIPGSKSQLALITADFIKIYDLSKDVLSPGYYFLLPTGKIRDATFIVPYQKGKAIPCLVVMSSLGYLYTQSLNEGSSATNGPFYMTNVLNVEHASLTEKNGQMGGGGVSVYYSHGLQLLFFSYPSHNFTASLSGEYDEITKLFPISFKSGADGNKSAENDTCLFDWSEIPGHPGLLTCFTHATTQPVVLMIEPESINLQEVKLVLSNSSKAKMQDVIAIRHSGTSEFNDKTTLIVLCEDGSLRIFLANATSTKFWLQPSLQPRSIFDRLAHTQRIKMAKKGKRVNSTNATILKSSSTDFTVDFFENCQLINLSDIEFGGNDLLYVYNKAQIKNRLNNTSMYIMSTKAFSIEITNKNKTQVITGIRVQLGNKGSEAVPTTMSIGSREIAFGSKLQKSRWFDVPLTHDQTLKYGTKLVLRFFGSEHPDEYTIVDSIKVYGKTKEAFGWIDEEKSNATSQEKSEPKTEKSTSQESIGQVSNISSASEYLCTSIDEISTYQDNVILTVYMSLNCLISALDIGSFSEEFCDDVKATVASLLVKTIPSPIHGQLKSLLTKVFQRKNDYYKFKDSLILTTIFNVLESPNKSNMPWISEEMFQKFVAEMDIIAMRRPENLTTVLDKNMLQSRIMDLVKIFFDILNIKPENKFLAPSCLPGLIHIKATIKALVEIMYATAIVDNNVTADFCKVWVKLLCTPEYSVNCYTALTLERLLSSQSYNVSPDTASKRQSRSSEGSVASSRSTSPQPTQSNSTITAQSGADNLAFSSQQIYSASQEDENEDDEDDDDDDDDDDSDGDEFEDIGPDDMEIDQDVLTETMENVMELGSSVLDREEQLIAMHAQEQQNATNNNTADDPQQEMAIIVGESEQESIPAQMSQDNLEVDFSQFGIDDQSMINYAIALSLQDQNETNDTSEAKHKDSPTEKAETSKAKILTEKEQNKFDQTSNMRLAFIEVLIDGIPSVLKDLIWEHTVPYFHTIMKLSTCLNTSIPQQATLLERLITKLLDNLHFNKEVAQDKNESLDSNVKNILICECITSLLLHDGMEELNENFSGYHVAKILLQSEIPQKMFNDLEYLLNNFWEKHITKEKTKVNDELNVLKITSPMFTDFKSPLIANLPSKSIGSKDDYFVNFTVVLLRLIYRYHHVQKNQDETFTFLQDNINILHNYMMQIESPVVKKRTRKLLLELSGTRERYREQRDYHMLIMNLKSCVEVYGQNSINSNVGFSYKTLKVLIGKLTVCLTIAKKRSLNWQNYCLSNNKCLNLLMDMSVAVGEHIAAIALEMLQLAFNPGKSDINKQDSSNVKKISPKEDKSLLDKKLQSAQLKMTTNAETLTKLILETTPESSLKTFFQHFLLKENSSSVRWSTHQLLLTLFNNVGEEWGKKLVTILWKLWPVVPLYGRKAAQFIDILGYLTLTVKHSESELMIYTDAIVTALRKQNKLLGEHPNSMLYQQLSNYVNFDGYYLESNPCLVCNQPEVPFSTLKLASIKSETRYTTTHHIVKLVNSYEIQKVVIKITDIKRTKMIKKATLFYNNKKVPAIVELKNKKSLWNKAKTEHLPQGQSEIKFNLPLPIVATNIMLEFTEFYENVSVTTETLQCPRCSASVQASPGICGNCGENVFQCHKCRSINYDERDPYLCNVCGFSKYAKFDITLSAKPCCAVDSIDSDEDREKTILAVGSLLIKADTLYSQLIVKKPQLEDLLLKTSKLSSFSSNDSKQKGVTNSRNAPSRPGKSDGSQPISLGVTALNNSVNKHIMMLAQKYCQDVKSLFEQLSKIMRTVLAFRKEVLKYDEKLREAINSPTDSNKSSFDGDFTLADSCQSAPNCYGCAFSTSQHCLNLLRAFANNPLTCQKLVRESVIPDLVEMNLRRGNAAQRLRVQNLICVLIKDNVEATTQLNNLLLEHIKASITYSQRNLISASVATEMHMLVASMNIPDSCWEVRLRSVLYLFQLSLKLSSPSVVENITYPCIQILQSKISSSLSNVETSNMLLSAEHSNELMVDIQAWMKNDPNHTFEEWKKMKCLVSYPKNLLEGLSKEEVRNIYIKERFARKWQKFIIDKKLKMNKIGFTNLKHDWLKQTLFCKSSLAVRQAACAIVTSMAENPNHRAQLIELLTSYLSELSVGGESAFELYQLFEDLIDKKQWKVYVVARGILPYLGNLIEMEINHLLELEASTLTLDLQQGYALKYLTELLSDLVHVPYVQQRYKTSLVSTILNSYLNLRKLMIPRTVVVDAAQENLLDLLEDMTTGTESETRAFMAVCIETIKKHDLSDFKTPLFIFERLANIIIPETNNVNEFFVSLDKDPLQEDFLQGRMVGNPYPSTEPGMGPLMRDVKNKICRDCDLVALLEDDYGMELLINNKIVSLDLAVRDVYNKIWVPTQVDDEPMKVVYRMRGLLGEATEDMVDSLDTEEDNRDEEEVYKLASILSENQGLEVMLERLEVIKNLKHGRQLLDIILKVLSYAVHLKQNRKHLMKPELNMLNILLGTLNLGLQAGDEAVKLVEQLLEIMDRVLQEAAADEKKQVLKGDKKKLTLLLQQIDSETVQSHTNVLRGLMRIIPLLSFGDQDLMQMLIDHFSVTLDFERYDKDHSPKDTLYLECFCEISTGIKNNTSGFQLKNLINKNGVVKNALEYIGKDVPQHKNLDSDEWKQFVAKPALTYVLRLLSGLCQNHSPTQLAISEHATCITDLHRLEQVSTQESIGSLAENVLEALRENATVSKLVDAVRSDTKAEKKKLAMEVRQRQLGALGMKTNEKGQLVTQSSILKQIGDLVEESGLTCIICREGYKFEPKKVLGVYTYTRRCSLEEYESSNRKMLGYTTVSHFNIVHYDCHTSAVRAARGREEWDSAMLQNANTKCNGLLPLWGPKVLESSFATCLARHNTYLQEATGYKEPNVQSTVHDLKHLLYRFASEKSFSEEAGGGGKQSNIQLIPYIIHMAQYVINTTRSFSREDSTFVAFIQTDGKKWVESSYSVEGPLYCTALALFIADGLDWKKHRLLILKRLIVIAQARHLSKTTTKDLSNKEVLEYKIYKSYLMFWALVDLVYKVLLKKVPQSDNDEQNWSVRLSDYIRHHDSELLENSEKLLSHFQDEYLPIETFDEFMDVAELLEETGSDVQSFVRNVLNNLA